MSSPASSPLDNASPQQIFLEIRLANYDLDLLRKHETTQNINKYDLLEAFEAKKRLPATLVTISCCTFAAFEILETFFIL